MPASRATAKFARPPKNKKRVLRFSRVDERSSTKLSSRQTTRGAPFSGNLNSKFHLSSPAPVRTPRRVVRCFAPGAKSELNTRRERRLTLRTRRRNPPPRPHLKIRSRAVCTRAHRERRERSVRGVERLPLCQGRHAASPSFDESPLNCNCGTLSGLDADLLVVLKARA